MGSSDLPALCSRDISHLAEVCVLVICNPGSSNPADNSAGTNKKNPSAGRGPETLNAAYAGTKLAVGPECRVAWGMWPE